MRKIISLLVVAMACSASRFAFAGDAPKPKMQTVDCSMVPCSDVGISRAAVKITIPQSCKLMILTRYYRDGKLDAAHPPLYFDEIPGKNDGRDVQLRLSIFDPDQISPDPSDKLKVTLDLGGASFPIWFTVKKDKTGKSVGANTSDPVELNRNYKLFDARMQDFEVDAKGNQRTPVLRVTSIVRLEPVQESNVKDYFQTTLRDAKLFPYTDSDDQLEIPDAK